MGYTVMSNTGFLVYVITILLLMKEVDKDMIANKDIAQFLAGVARKGDQMRIMDLPTPNSTGSRPAEGEKTAKCDEDLGTEHHDTNVETTDSLPVDDELIADTTHQDKSLQTKAVSSPRGVDVGSC